MSLCLIAFTLLAGSIVLVASESLQEVSKLQLASELNVGFELVSKCTSYQYEAAQLCTGRQPFRLYGDSASGCTKYYWCSPERGACTFTCQTGTVFNQACSCCEVKTDGAFDTSSCSSSTSSSIQQQQAAATATLAGAPTTRQHLRRLQATDPSSSSSSILSSEDRERIQARARARLAQRRRRRKAAAARAAAAAADGYSDDSITSNPSIMANRQLDNGVSEWTPYGKKYRGPWAVKNIVKEPAFKVITPDTTTGTAAATTAGAAAVVEVPVSKAVPVTGSTDSPSDRRHLLQQQQTGVGLTSGGGSAVQSSSSSSSSSNGAITMRQVHMKCVQRLAAQAAAAAAASGDPAESAATADALEREANTGMHSQHMIRIKIRPMDKKPAAKAIDPEDEKAAPFAAAVGASEPAVGSGQPVHVRRQRPGQQAAAASA